MGIPALTQTAFLSILDYVATSKLTADDLARLATLGQIAGKIYGDGVTQLGTGDPIFIGAFNVATTSLLQRNALDKRNGESYNPYMSQVDAYLRSVGGTNFTELRSFLTYVNTTPTGAAYTFLVLSNIADLYNLYQSRNTKMLLPAAGVAPPITTLGTIAIGASAGHAALTAGSVIPATNDTTAGTQGYVGAKAATAHVTTNINGTLTLTFTATGQDSTGAQVASPATGNTIVTGRTWTVVLSNLAAGSNVDLTPANAGDRIYSLTGVTGAGTATAGAVTITTKSER